MPHSNKKKKEMRVEGEDRLLKSTKTKTNQVTFDEQASEGNTTIPTAEEKREAKAAAKRKRAKEKMKEAKAKERERSEQEQKMKEVEARKAYSAIKCSFCGSGILDCGFERFGQKFCSTKCSRAAVKS
jgi:flagellar biosynthesis GTPase FlhF